MLETLVPINLPPGLYRNGTKLDASGRWYDGNLMRWVEGKPQPIGGWRRMLTEEDITMDPIGLLTAGPDDIFRTAHAWRSSSTGALRVAFGGSSHVWVIAEDITGSSAGHFNITPSGLTIGFRVAGIASEGGDLKGLIEADSWTFDTFGDTLVGVLTSDGALYSWPGINENAMTAVTGAPTGNEAVVVTPERFVVVLGAGGDSRKVQWADQETLTTWTPTASNQAGDFTLQTKGRLKCGARSRQQTLLWTDTDLWSMNFIGGSLVYSFQQEGDNCGIISSRAAVIIDTQAFWMGTDGFYKYDGFVQPIPCEVRDYVFGEFGRVQASQVWAMTKAKYNEVWWHYCSDDDQTQPDRYVAYNFRDNHWHFGELERSCGLDAGPLPNPIAVATDLAESPDGRQVVWEHEYLQDRGSTTPYLESGPVTLDKDRVMRIQRIVPDVSALGDANVSIYTSMFPTQSETLNGPYSLANPTDVRLSAKHIRLKVSQATETSWRVGTIQLGVIPQGRR